MARLTTDRADPDLTHGVDTSPVPQAKAYLIGEDTGEYVRPFRDQYRHVGPPGPDHELRPLTDDEATRYEAVGYAFYEEYPAGSDILGRYWTNGQLALVKAGGCEGTTTMSAPLAATYAVSPGFYGATYCASCQMHRPVAEFVWTADGSPVGS